MLARRIIPCLDVKDGMVVKGTQFKNHFIVGDVIELAKYYSEAGADELVFYDITASSENRCIDYNWVDQVAKNINIPFCVAGGIRSLRQAEIILSKGADKISINSPALEKPSLISEFASRFGTQCIVVGIDSKAVNGTYYVYQYTGNSEKTKDTQRKTEEWILETQELGAGEIVLNCMNKDGMHQGYDLKQLSKMRKICQVPLIASGGAGNKNHFLALFQQAQVDGALAASVFHQKKINLRDLKNFLNKNNIRIRHEWL